MAGHDVCQGVGLASDSGIKGMSHIYFHDTHSTIMIWKFKKNVKMTQELYSTIKYKGWKII